MKKILLIAAHPDDEILGCGGFLVKYNSSVNFRVVILGEGMSARYHGSEINSDNVKKEIDKRNSFCLKALNSINITDIKINHINCGRFDQFPLIDIGKIIEKEIKDFEPDTILTHSSNDTNNDHILTFQATLQATRPGALNQVKRVLCYEVLSSTEWRFIESFTPNYYVQLSEEHLQQKIECFDHYVTEKKDFPFPRSPQGIKTLANYRGMQVGVPYAEAFRIVREIEI